MARDRDREEALRALHAATRDLVDAETPQAVAEIAVETAEEVLDLPLSAVWLYDETGDELRHAAQTDAAAELFDRKPTFSAGDSLAWQVFESGEPRVFEDVSRNPEVNNPATPMRSELVLPLGEYGLMTIGSTEPAVFDDRDVALAQIHAANTETALRQVHRERELERQNERLAAFASVVSHDLRNPLNVAQGRLELLAEECDSEHVAPTERALDRMEALLADLLALAREGEVVGDRRAVNLATVAREGWENVETDDADLAVDETVTLSADEERLCTLLENLFRNAVEHAGPDVTVTVGATDGGDGFYVADDGPGIPESDREKVLDRGYTTNEDGTGYGLAIVREIAEAHGWSLAVGEGADGGARFEIVRERA